MSDLISRQAAIDALAEHEKSNGHNYTLFVDIVSECAEIIRDLPSAQPQRTGHWIEDDDEMFVMCSECSEINDYISAFCPNCGAKMINARGEQDERTD